MKKANNSNNTQKNCSGKQQNETKGCGSSSKSTKNCK